MAPLLVLRCLLWKVAPVELRVCLDLRHPAAVRKLPR